VFIDFWNFQLNWNSHNAGVGCDWSKLPAALIRAAQVELLNAGITDELMLDETIVHASVERNQTPLRHWLTNFLDRQPSFDVKVRERQSRPRPVHCKACGTDTAACPACGAEFRTAAEKGVDTAIVTDLLSLAWQGAYDVAVLVTSDADFIPAVEHVQSKGLKVVNAAWPKIGHQLRAACWAGCEVTDFAHQIRRAAT
jgi:uncharacterized LabA/DUF88 family protein